MITALQNFISKKGKWFFVLLLLVVVVSFVLYLSQGSSIFDLLPDPRKETKEFYSYDLNDPDQRRLLSAQNRVASDFGVVISPYGEVMESADNQVSFGFEGNLYNLERRIRFQQDQSLISDYLQAREQFENWRAASNNEKASVIIRIGVNEPEFSQSSIRAKLAMDAQADAWGLLPLEDNIPSANDSFREFLTGIDPVLGIEENRSAAFENVGRLRGFKKRGIESITYSHFRASLVDEIYYDVGFVLNEEAKIDLRLNDFAWDAEALSLELEDLGETGPYLAKLTVNELPKAGDSLTVLYGDQNRTFVCVDQIADLNTSDVQFLRGMDVAAFAKNLSGSIEKENLGFSASLIEPEVLAFSPDASRLPQSFPSFKSSSESVVFSDEMLEPLKEFHEEKKNEDVFARPSRTFATAVTFRSNDFFTVPEEPGEARMRSYFERNKEIFNLPPLPPPPVLLPPATEANGTALPPQGEQGPVGQGEANASEVVELALPPVPIADLNVTKPKQVTFEEVREEVRQQIIEGERTNAERRSKDLARAAALNFLIEINNLGDELHRKYPTFEQRRKSAELAKLIGDAGGVSAQIDFSEKEMVAKGDELGLEKVETLQEVASLNEKMFFTDRSRKTREGFTLFLLDKKEEKGPGVFSEASFSLLFEEFASQFRADEFVKLADQTLDGLQGDGNVSLPPVGLKIEIERRNSGLARGYYEGVNGRIGSQLQKLGEERQLISSAERDSNSTKEQLARKESIDAEIEVIREKQTKVTKEMTLAQRLLSECSNLTPDGKWSELERTENSVIFVRLKKAYTLKVGELKSNEIETRAKDLQFARAELGRDLLLRDIISRELEKKN